MQISKMSSYTSNAVTNAHVINRDETMLASTSISTVGGPVYFAHTQLPFSAFITRQAFFPFTRYATSSFLDTHKLSTGEDQKV
jgi:hypothetical protein